MKYNVLILGASYGSLFSTKLLMAGHRVSLVCTKPTADLINREGTDRAVPDQGARGAARHRIEETAGRAFRGHAGRRRSGRSST